MTKAETVITRVCEEYGVTREKLAGKSRESKYVVPRHAASYLLHVRLGLSAQEVASLLGMVNHTSILYAVQRARRGLEYGTLETEPLRRLDKELFPVNGKFPKDQNPRYISDILTSFLAKKFDTNVRKPMATDGKGRTYLMLNTERRLLSTDPVIASIVDAANYFKGDVLKIK